MYPLCLRPGAGQGVASCSVQTSHPKSRTSAPVLAQHARDVEAQLDAKLGFMRGAWRASALFDSTLRRSGSRQHAPRRALHRSTRAEANAEAEREVKCTFQVKRAVDFGSELLVMGNANALGQWNKDYAPMMQWSEGCLLYTSPSPRDRSLS
eukprot:435303-Pyramimonas_sp.AAC.1